MCDSRSASPTVCYNLLHPARVGLRSREVEWEGDVLLGGERGQQVELLEDESDSLPPQQCEVLLVQRAGIDIADDDPACAETIESRRALHECGLAGTRGAHDGGEAARLEADRHTIECPNLVLALPVDLVAVQNLGSPHQRGLFVAEGRHIGNLDGLGGPVDDHVVEPGGAEEGFQPGVRVGPRGRTQA